MNKKKINVRLLSTVILVVYGYHGFGKCLSTSYIAAKILKKMGYNDVQLRCGKAVVSVGNKTFFFCNIDTLPQQVQSVINSQTNHVDLAPTDNDKWHSWCEVDGMVIDANCRKVTLDAQPISNLKLPIKKAYYTRDISIENDRFQLLNEQESEATVERSIQKAVDLYNSLLNKMVDVQIEEGMIRVDEKGDFVWLHRNKDNINIGDSL